MQPQDPLAQLQPLRSPPEISWWPPAPGWWLVAICVLAALATAVWLLARRHRQRRYRRVALAQLKQLRATTNDSYPEFATTCNQLLKTVALRSFNRRQVAALSGESWLDFLNQSLPAATVLFSNDMLDGLYSSHEYSPSSGEDPRIESLYRAAQHWIKRHRRGA